jgi:hypothetical protein
MIDRERISKNLRASPLDAATLLASTAIVDMARSHHKTAIAELVVFEGRGKLPVAHIPRANGTKTKNWLFSTAVENSLLGSILLLSGAVILSSIRLLFG